MKTVSVNRVARFVADLEDLLQGLIDDASPEEADTDPEVVGLGSSPRPPPETLTPGPSLAKQDEAKKAKREH